jgi:AmpD protein
VAKARPERLGWTGGWWRAARRCPSPNHGPRPRGSRTELALIHSISLPPGEYGGPGVEDLFLNRLDPEAHPYYRALRGLRVSAHFFISRDGRVLQFVPCHRRAWHAGASHWHGRDDCNDFSVGIELEGLEGDRFEPCQYAVLARLLRALARRWGVREATGHETVAPGRKHDPGVGFDWKALARALRRVPLDLWHTAAATVRPRAAAARRRRAPVVRRARAANPVATAAGRVGGPSGKALRKH